MQDLDTTVKALYLLRYDEMGEPDHLEVSLGYTGKKRTLAGVKPCFFKYSDSYPLHPDEQEKDRLYDESYRIALGSNNLSNVFSNYFLSSFNFKGHFVSVIEGEIAVEEPNHIEVLPTLGLSAKLPYELYTRNISNSVGIGVYNHFFKTGSLYHLTLDQDISTLGKQILDHEIETGNNNLYLSIVSNINNFANDSQKKKLTQSRNKCINFALKNKDSFKKFIISSPDEPNNDITYFSVDMWNGIFKIF